MTSNIFTNMDAVRSHNIFAKSNANMSKAMTNATSGMRLNSVQDGPAQWAVSERMRERINSLNQVDQNVQNDTAMLKTAEGGINNTIDILRTLRARVEQATDSSTNDNDRQAISKEVETLLDQIDYNANQTRYNGKLLLAMPNASSDQRDVSVVSSDGTDATKLRFQIGDDSNAYAEFELSNLTVKGLSLDTFTEAISTLNNKTATDLKSDTSPLAFLRPGNASATAFLDNLENALNTALNAATDVGSYEQRLGYTADNVATQIENLQASDSTIRDADMAKEISDYMKWSVLSQASQYMLAQSNQNAFAVLNLLQ